MSSGKQRRRERKLAERHMAEAWAAWARGERTVALAPHWGQPRAELGELLAGLGRDAAALRCYERALTLEPDHEDWPDAAAALRLRVPADDDGALADDDEDPVAIPFEPWPTTGPELDAVERDLVATGLARLCGGLSVERRWALEALAADPGAVDHVLELDGGSGPVELALLRLSFDLVA
ncbi:MAG: tetratricopeptide repeat protein [Planctomycetota bacterium]